MSDKNPQLYVLDMKRADIGDILSIIEECSLSEWSADGLQQEIEREDSLKSVVKRNGETLGFMLARLVSDSELDILNFGVLNKQQKQGIGSMLWKRLLERALEKSVESIWLEVRESNTNAIKFYKSKGFTIIQMRKNFYKLPTENALLMNLSIEKNESNFS